MKLIVGLGNPGKKYENNRHNVGYQFVDYIVNKLKFSIFNFQFSNKSQVSKFKIVKSQAFMNESGMAVRKLIDHWSLNIDHLYVVHDDLDLKLGEFKIQKGKGPKLHNGISSIEKELGRSDFWRVRIGVDNRNPENRIAGEKYVLQDFTLEEKQIVSGIFEKIIENLITVILTPPIGGGGI